MKVLIACEESQEVCKAFRTRGHEAYSCDVQEPSGGHPEWHILGDALKALEGGQVVTMDGEIHHGKPVFVKFNKLLPDSVRGKTQVVIGEFICDDIRRIGPEYCIVKEDIETAIAGSCLSIKQVKEYAGWDIGMNYADMKDLYGWHISGLKIYDEPVKLEDFWAIQPCTHRGDCCTFRRWNAEKLICRGEAFGIERPPQSWCYVEEGR